MTVALFPGTFDPVTYGHLDVVRRGAELFPKILVAVGTRAGKATLFSQEERVVQFKKAVADLGNVAVEPFSGLVVDFARKKRARVLLRGVRNQSDYDYEFTMAQTNRLLAPEMESVFLFPSLETISLSSTMIKEILAAGGAVEDFVPPHVADALRSLDQP